MKLTKHTDYALRILIYSSLQPKERLLSIQEVTDVYELSRNHVMKIVQKLGQEGYLTTIRGKGGGFHLGRKPEDINLGELISKLEPSMKLVNCKEPVCRISPACRLQSVLSEAMSSFQEVLNSYTLADLVDNRDELSNLLAISA
ncbi:BadM/Rrf2 family transcriptional regulator [Endozoicomonas sp. OPT23]|uniref:Rrf2 family transcriptional regulator n=1 Tax=Endozoicomonas sp. OPT23 TaxID=2072845 RepID=UPI00129C098E|nr:Rrf2 family transcriptional regulator [Endozoicomonas sp. OPT23]MRI32895.1 BadM/Rrf2 family transcriptional regulator [Endozoicomonas sp. OPT23]